MDPTYDWETSLKLLALFVALSAYIGNVRRDMAKRCTTLQEDIEEKLPLLKKKGEIDDDQERAAIEKKAAEREQQEKKIALLVLSDAPLVVASLVLLADVLFIAPPPSRFFGFNLAMFLFGAGIVFLSWQHMLEWRKSAQRISEWQTPPPRTPMLAATIVVVVIIMAGASLRSCQDSRKRYEPPAGPTSWREDLSRVQRELDVLRNDTNSMKTEMAAARAEAREAIMLARQVKAKAEAPKPPKNNPSKQR